jgi:hypothetical protein
MPEPQSHRQRCCHQVLSSDNPFKAGCTCLKLGAGAGRVSWKVFRHVPLSRLDGNRRGINDDRVGAEMDREDDSRIYEWAGVARTKWLGVRPVRSDCRSYAGCRGGQ